MRIAPRAVVLSIVALAVVAGIAVLAAAGPPPARDLDWSGLVPVAPSRMPRSPMPVPTPPVARNVYFAPMGDFPLDKAEALVAHYREKFGLTIEIAAPILVPPDAFNTARDQFGADSLLEAIKASDVAVADREAVIIGLIDDDMYIEELSWRYAYALRSKQRAACRDSTARFDAYRADEDMQTAATAEDGHEEPGNPLLRPRAKRGTRQRHVWPDPRPRRSRRRQRGFLTRRRFAAR